MRLVQTLVVRDEADIVDAQVAYHLNAGVDFVIATDHESRDGTTEILEAYAREGYLRRIPESGWNEEARWRTRMARLAATKHGADWVINTDADEFWMPRGGTLKELLAAVPSHVGIVWALSRQFVPRPAAAGSVFAESMVVRISAAAAINDPTSPYRPHAKVAHRADPDVEIRHGAHAAVSRRFAPLPDWYPADVLHFPFRSLEQYERKSLRRVHGDKPLGQYVRAFDARERGRIAELYQTLLVDDAILSRGRSAGTLVVDTRLRDALRVLAEPSDVVPRSPTGRFRLPGPAEPGPGFPDRRSTAADSDVVAEGAALSQADLVRLVRHVDGLRKRSVDLEGRIWARAARRSQAEPIAAGRAVAQ